MNNLSRRSSIMAKENDRNLSFQPSAFKTINSQIVNPSDISDKGVNSYQYSVLGNSPKKAQKALFGIDELPVQDFLRDQYDARGSENTGYNSNKLLNKNANSQAVYTSSRKSRRRNLDSDLNTIMADLKSLSVRHNLNNLTAAIDNLQNLEKRLGKTVRKENLPPKENLAERPAPKKRSSKLAAMLKNMYGDPEHNRETQENIAKEKHLIHEIFKSKTDLKNRLRSSKSSVRFRKTMKNMLPVESKSLKKVELELKSRLQGSASRENLTQPIRNNTFEEHLQQLEQSNLSEKKPKVEFSKNQLLTLTKFYVLQKLLAKKKKDNLTQNEKKVLAQLNDVLLDEKKVQGLKDNLLKHGIADLEKGLLIRNREV